MKETRNAEAFRILVIKARGQKLLERPRRKYEYSVDVDLKEIGYEIGSWMEMAHYRFQWRLLVLGVLSHQVPVPELYHAQSMQSSAACYSAFRS
jgi:hypothetical protein